MMRSMFSGVAGLKTHQVKMDVIGNNIANVNTTAYKSSSINFSELLYQTQSRASGPNGLTGRAGINPKQIGLGVQSAAITNAITTGGATQNTGNPFDIKIHQYPRSTQKAAMSAGSTVSPVREETAIAMAVGPQPWVARGSEP